MGFDEDDAAVLSQNPVDAKYMVHPIYSTPFFINAKKGPRERLRAVIRAKNRGSPESRGIEGGNA